MMMTSVVDFFYVAGKWFFLMFLTFMKLVKITNVVVFWFFSEGDTHCCLLVIESRLSMVLIGPCFFGGF